MLDTSTILAVFLLARRFLPPAACVFAAVFVGFNPFLIYFSSLILSETLFIALLAWGMLLLTARYVVDRRDRAPLSILVRPSAMLSGDARDPAGDLEFPGSTPVDPTSARFGRAGARRAISLGVPQPPGHRSLGLDDQQRRRDAL